MKGNKIKKKEICNRYFHKQDNNYTYTLALNKNPSGDFSFFSAKELYIGLLPKNSDKPINFQEEAKELELKHEKIKENYKAILIDLDLSKF